MDRDEAFIFEVNAVTIAPIIVLIAAISTATTVPSMSLNLHIRLNNR
jgi:hypothetical protein